MQVLESEAQSLQKSSKKLGSSFENVIHLIASCSGRVVISGVGKSALVGQKIVATLNSTGTPSLFMHAADAVHGDLGMVQADDVVLLISQSGNTPEIKFLLQFLKEGPNVLVGMTGKMDSYLAQNVHHVISSEVDAESCPHNLAPTNSTTLQMALGDAIAVCLMELRGFAPEDFARVHPGGNLGKRLYLKAEELSNGVCPVVSPSAGIREVILRISEGRVGAVAVVENGVLVGVITDGDLRRLLERAESVASVTASEIMNTNPKTLQSSAMAVEAMSIIRKHNISQVLLVDVNQSPVGFVHVHDLMREGILV